MATIEINGKSYQVENGKMIIEVTDELGIHIPRFCYHKKLSVAANCRMCLVHIENSRKPVPACATPITEGMKIHTNSEETIHSQKIVMEFLLINHPLDCPICDQGGECELQDVSLGFGLGESAYHDTKRSVADEQLGSLISTEMTRCIHCTRCVRFGEEIAGIRELGATGRGEKMRIGTYVQRAMTSEISGNIIDLCPVGALTSKPFRFSARAWELTQHPAISPHDCLGSHLSVHLRRQQVMRVVPREAESINETWLSDRDRFSYLGLSHSHRLLQPKIKEAGKWCTVSWEIALQRATHLIKDCVDKHGVEQFAAFASSSATVEEMYLLQRWMRAIGVNNLDHRLQQVDFSDQTHASLMPRSSLPYAALEKQAAILLVGTHLHREVPLAAVRVRKAFLSGANVFAINPIAYDFPFNVRVSMITSPHDMVLSLGKVLLSLVSKNQLPQEVQQWLEKVETDAVSQVIADTLKKDGGVIVTGMLAENHPYAAVMRTLIHYIQAHAPVTTVRLTAGGNTQGAWVAGMLPHRLPAGQRAVRTGLHAKDAIEQGLKGYFLLNVNPAYDFANATFARKSLFDAECVIALTAFDEPHLEACADVLLPIAAFIETSGTYINLDHGWQTMTGCCAPAGEARPAWKVLRVLANLMNCERFDYESSEAVLHELKQLIDPTAQLAATPYLQSGFPQKQPKLVRVGEWPLYKSDALVRHAQALQESGAADAICVRMHPDTIKQHNLAEQVTVSQEDVALTLPLKEDRRVAKGNVHILNGLSETMDLGYPFAEIIVKR